MGKKQSIAISIELVSKGKEYSDVELQFIDTIKWYHNTLGAFPAVGDTLALNVKDESQLSDIIEYKTYLYIKGRAFVMIGKRMNIVFDVVLIDGEMAVKVGAAQF